MVEHRLFFWVTTNWTYAYSGHACHDVLRPWSANLRIRCVFITCSIFPGIVEALTHVSSTLRKIFFQYFVNTVTITIRTQENKTGTRVIFKYTHVFLNRLVHAQACRLLLLRTCTHNQRPIYVTSNCLSETLAHANQVPFFKHVSEQDFDYFTVYLGNGRGHEDALQDLLVVAVDRKPP